MSNGLSCKLLVALLDGHIQQPDSVTEAEKKLFSLDFQFLEFDIHALCAWGEYKPFSPQIKTP